MTDPLKLAVRPTPELAIVNDTLCRVWQTDPPDGSEPVRLYVALVQVSEGQDREAFERALIALGPATPLDPLRN